MPRANQVKYWCFTINNYDEEHWKAYTPSAEIKAIVFQVGDNFE